MTNEQANKIERHLNAIDDRLGDCFGVMDEGDYQEGVYESTYKLAKKLINVVHAEYAMKLKIEHICVNHIGNIVMMWFNGRNNSKSFASAKCSYIYMEIGRSKFTCFSNIDFNITGIFRPERFNRTTAPLIKTVFNHFYSSK